MKKKLRIGINAQIPSGSGAGGIETVLRALTPLGQLEDGAEEYVFITHWSDPDWLKPLLTGRQKIVSAPKPQVINESYQTNSLEFLKQKAKPFARRVRNFIAPTKVKISVPVSDGFYESLNCDVIHFPYQDYVHCRVPTVYNPHDLQHLHYPGFFTEHEFQRREIIYPEACRAARTVVAASQYVKRDIAEKYKIDAEKIQVIAWSPAGADLYEFAETEANSLFEKYDCPPRPFMLYPAMTWEHKNHLRLIEAIYSLRERENLKINLVCTGHKNAFYPQIEKRLRELNLEKQIRFTGIVEYKELSIFYRSAQFVIIPTLFEAMSAPLFEAWQYGAPVACSSVTSLPEQAADAALLFDPFSVEEIIGAIKKMASGENLRAQLRELGFQRLMNFNRERTAKAYRAVYRQAAGIELNEEDEYLLNIDWTRDS
ncbi:MAG: glycosyltransferase family 4 protein [Pyrinomonadaceae bacterium]